MVNVKRVVLYLLLWSIPIESSTNLRPLVCASSCQSQLWTRTFAYIACLKWEEVVLECTPMQKANDPIYIFEHQPYFMIFCLTIQQAIDILHFDYVNFKIRTFKIWLLWQEFNFFHRQFAYFDSH